MNGVIGGSPVHGPPRQCFTCTHADCSATFSRQWKLKEHESVHTGERPCRCTFAGCGRSFTRRYHLRRHMLLHTGVKQFKCTFATCTKSFFGADQLKKHVRYAHGEECFKCNQPGCSLTFKKRRKLRLHLKEHGVPAKFKCQKDGCGAMFDSHTERKAHEKKHTGYRCPHDECQALEHTWGKLQKHRAKHSATFTCSVCKKVFKKAKGLRRHKRSHASHKPVLVCPRDNCKAYFSTTFNLQHHIRKVHLQLFKYKCYFPNCPRTFAMRESLTRHLYSHDPDPTSLKKRRRPKKSWQKRLNGHNWTLVEDNLRRLFTRHVQVSRRAKVEAELSGLFNERKIPHAVGTEADLRSLFSMKLPEPLEEPEVPGGVPLSSSCWSAVLRTVQCSSSSPLC
uniref:P43 5S RNA-binding protein-like isoform X2 n=1 Tax=Monopterus albus TaxID=43700 RepID=UPI0009B36AC5|nr:P43 5S RNA-binding protein-like isoform X2 [Monopterus albus]